MQIGLNALVLSVAGLVTDLFPRPQGCPGELPAGDTVWPRGSVAKRVRRPRALWLRRAVGTEREDFRYFGFEARGVLADVWRTGTHRGSAPAGSSLRLRGLLIQEPSGSRTDIHTDKGPSSADP